MPYEVCKFDQSVFRNFEKEGLLDTFFLVLATTSTSWTRSNGRVVE